MVNNVTPRTRLEHNFSARPLTPIHALVQNLGVEHARFVRTSRFPHPVSRAFEVCLLKYLFLDHSFADIPVQKRSLFTSILIWVIIYEEFEFSFRWLIEMH